MGDELHPGPPRLQSAAFQPPSGRGPLLTSLCSLTLLMMGVSAYAALRGGTARLWGAELFWPSFAVVNGAELVAMVGLWRARRFGLYALTVAQGVDMGLGLLAGDAHAVPVLTSVAVVALGWSQWERLR